jgi:hypothetical protein
VVKGIRRRKDRNDSVLITGEFIMKDFQKAFDQFYQKASSAVAERSAKLTAPHSLNVLKYENGRRYIRLVLYTGISFRSAWGFVDKETGDVLKAASWKAPAKGSRGNIFNEDNGASALTPYGIRYLK